MTTQERIGSIRAALPKVLLRVAIVLAALEVLYLVLANVALMTPLLRRVVNPADDVEIDYDWAYSPWPGRIYLKNLALRLEDYNVQFSVGIERGMLDVRLEELARRRFHAVRVSAEGTSYRMRHKLHEVGKNARRVAAYPPIPGFSDPPLYRGPHPPPIPDEKYNLWDVRIENVDANVREVWVLEYRFQGQGRAWGSFHVRPARWYEVEGSGLTLEQGSLTVAGVPVAARTKLEVSCRVLGTDPRAASGLEPFRTMFASMRGSLEGADLRALDVYLGPFLGVSANGGADLRIDVAMDGGVLREKSSIRVVTHDVGVGDGHLSVWGAPELELSVPAEGKKPVMRLEARAKRLRALGPAEGAESPYVEGVAAHLAFTHDLARPLELVSAGVKLPKAVVPELAWFEPLFEDSKPRLGGSATAELDVERSGDQRVRGNAAIALSGVKLGVASWNVGGDFAVKSRFQGASQGAKGLALEGFRFRTDGATLSVGGRRTPRFTALISSDDLSLPSFEPLRTSGSLQVNVSRVEPLLPLVVESNVLRELMVAALGLQSITAQARFEVDPERKRFEVRDARSGALDGRGFLEVRDGDSNGRFLFVTHVANVGVEIRHGESSIKPLVSDDWLGKKAFVLSHAPR